MIRKRKRTSDGRRKSQRRGGATLVEMAVVLPWFFLFVSALFEFGHVFMVSNTLTAAARAAGRMGAAENVSTSQVEQKARDILAEAFDIASLTVYVRDASVFDDPQVEPESIDYETLGSIELTNAEPRQLFIVRVEIPYDDIAILGPDWITQSITLSGQSVMRHE